MGDVLHRFVMHTDNPDVVKDNKMEMVAEGPDWKRRDHPNGVREHVHEYGSSLFETHAKNLREAQDKIYEAQKFSDKISEGNVSSTTVWRNPNYAFHKSNKGKVKPTIIKGGKKDDPS